MGKRAVDMTGQRFARLTVLGRAPTPIGLRGAFWYCRCDCGVEKVMPGAPVRNGSYKSCGCFAREMATERSKTHGMSQTPTWWSWTGMVTRCTKPNSASYAYYGGRGIKVCERWLDFSSFLADMGERPADGTIDRIDVNGDYCPENCRWATRKEQTANRRPAKNDKLEAHEYAQIRWLRNEAGASLADLCGMFGISITHASGVALGRQGPPLTPEQAAVVREPWKRERRAS